MPLLGSSSRGHAIVHKAFRFSVLMWLVAVFPAAAADDDGINNFMTRTEAQTNALQSKALLGDGYVALVLAGDPRISAKERMYWTTIAAEDGFQPAIEELGVRLTNDESDPRNLIRARYWLNISKARYPENKLVDYDLCKLNAKMQSPPPVCVFPLSEVRPLEK
jgi:hypothetical protein